MQALLYITLLGELNGVEVQEYVGRAEWTSEARLPGDHGVLLLRPLLAPEDDETADVQGE